MEYQDIVIQKAEKYQVEPALIYAVIRSESNFRPEVESSAGAVGLDVYKRQHQLRGQEITLYNAVFFMDQFHQIQLHQLRSFILPERTAADENIQVLPSAVSYTHLDVYKRQEE